MATRSIYELIDTWNAAGFTFEAIKMNVTDTLSAADSKLIDLQTDSVTQLSVDKAGNVVIAGDMTLAGSMTLASYTRKPIISTSQATGGPTAPSWVTVDTSRGLQFDADAEEVFIDFRIPEDWDGISDIKLVPHWLTEPADQMQDGETVKWDINYRSIAEGEAVDNGVLATATATTTQTGTSLDKEFKETELVLPFDDADQPLTAGEYILLQFTRDVTGDTYTGGAIVQLWYFEYDSNTLPLI
jgi:hypothetical protein